jgi:hypothetical protein
MVVRLSVLCNRHSWLSGHFLVLISVRGSVNLNWVNWKSTLTSLKEKNYAKGLSLPTCVVRYGMLVGILRNCFTARGQCASHVLSSIRSPSFDCTLFPWKKKKNVIKHLQWNFTCSFSQDTQVLRNVHNKFLHFRLKQKLILHHFTSCTQE